MERPATHINCLRTACFLAEKRAEDRIFNGGGNIAEINSMIQAIKKACLNNRYIR